LSAQLLQLRVHRLGFLKVDAFLAALRAGDFEGLVAVLDSALSVRKLRRGSWRAAHAAEYKERIRFPREIRGARTWAKGAIAFSRLAHFVQPMVVDGALGLVWAPGGQLSRVLRFTIMHGKIVQVEVIADPARLRDLDLAVLKD